MSNPKVKKITRAEIDEAQKDPDACVYYLSYNEDMTEIVMSVKSQRSMTPYEYLQSLASFIDDTSENPNALFVSDACDSHEIDPTLN